MSLYLNPPPLPVIQLPAQSLTIDPLTTPILQPKQTSGFRDILFGSIAGVCGKIVEYPFDTVKVKLQTQALTTTTTPLLKEIPRQVKQYTGSIDCFYKTYRTQGLRGLYCGLSSPLVGSVLENATLFFTYNATQNHVPSSLPCHLLICGGLAGFVTSFILTPIELVKCRMQVHPPPTTITPVQIIKQTIRTTGVFGLYRGHFATTVRESGGSAAWFGCYELVNKQLIQWRNVCSKAELHVSDLLVSGACAGISYNVVLFPADVIKSRMQTSSMSNIGFWKTGTDLFKAEGVRGLYRGCWVTVLKSTPTSAVIFGVYEWLNRSL